MDKVMPAENNIIPSRPDDEIQRSILEGLQSLLPHWDFEFSAPYAHKNFHGFTNPHPLTSPTELKLVRRENSGPINLEKHMALLEKLLIDIKERLFANSKFPIYPAYNINIRGKEITVTLAKINRFEIGNSEPKLLPDKYAQELLTECRNEISGIKLHEAIEKGSEIFDAVRIKINPANAKECNLDLGIKPGINAAIIQEAKELAEALGKGFGDVHVMDCRQTEKNNILVVLNAGTTWGAQKLQKYIAVHLEDQITVERQAAAVVR